jgi:catechol-2,3-dioxygenase
VEPGLGRLVRFRDPEGNTIELVSDVEHIGAACGGGGRPLSLNHLILYAGDLLKQQNFFVNVLGMRVTDTVPGLMTFLRCNSNHHSFGFIALPRWGLQHSAFDVASRTELSEVIIRLSRYRSAACRRTRPAWPRKHALHLSCPRFQSWCEESTETAR